MKVNVCLFVISAIALASCVDIPDFSSTPNISYNGIAQEFREDSAGGRARQMEFITVTINFEDGDGDLGISDNNLQDSVYRQRYTKVPNWGHEGNYELVTLEQGEDGTWREIIIALDGPKWFEDLKPDGKPGPIKGKLDLYFRQYYSPNGNTVMRKRKYKVRIIDRAFHISQQTEESDEVLVPVARE